MKHTFLLLFILIALSTGAQDKPGRPIFRNGYQRIGFSFLGNKLDQVLSPRANVFNGNYGADPGYCLEFGRNFYFNKHSNSSFRVGLDWTYISLAYNKMNWSKYIGVNNTASIDGTSIAASVSGRLGPVISYNPVGKLIIDARFQVAPSFYFFDQGYYKNEGQANEQYFEFIDSKRQELDNTYDAENIKNRVSFGIKTGIGLTVRWKAIGIALDYLPGKVKASYASNEGHGQEKIKANNLQIKLSFAL